MVTILHTFPKQNTHFWPSSTVQHYYVQSLLSEMRPLKSLQAYEKTIYKI